MAQTGGIKAIIAALFDNSGLKKAQTEFGKFSKMAKSVLGAVGVGFSLNAVVQQFQEVTKAAVADNKSQALLATQLKNTVGATADQVAAVEKSINAMQLQAAVVDDKIRPAFAQLTRATGDLGQANKLTSLALDVSAGTGRDLQSVAIALGKAYNGNTTALQRLGVNVKGVSDPMALLKQQFEGAAAAAAKTDPYAQMQVIFDNLKETIGNEFLPYLQAFSTWLASPEGQDRLDQFAQGFATAADNVGTLFAAISEMTSSDAWKALFPSSSEANRRNQALADAFYAKGVKGTISVGGNLMQRGGVDETKRLLNQRGMLPKSLADYVTPTPITPVPKVVGGIKSVSDAAKKAADAAAKAAKDAQDAADKQAQAYLDAAAAGQKLVDANKELMASFKDLFATKTPLGQFEQAAVDAFSNIYDEIKSALADGQILDQAAANLKAYADKERSALQAIGKQRDILAGKLDVARSITSGVLGLAQLTSFLETTTSSVTETVTSIVNGIQLATTKTFDVVTSGGLVDNFQKIVDKTKAFAKNLLQLKALGLNKNLFAQLVQAGADAGGATAQAIVDGGSETITALNDLYGQLDSAAATIAETSTQTLYEVGQQVVSNGFIEGLVSQSDALAAAAGGVQGQGGGG